MTLESVVELRMIASVPTQIVSPQASKPVMSMVQDSLLGTYLLSQSQSLTLEEMTRLMCAVSAFSENLPPPAQPGPDPRWTGSQLISLFLPNISYKKKSPDGTKTLVEIAGGQLSSGGILDSNQVGKKNGSLFHITWNDYGPGAARDLFNGFTFTSNTWLQIQGFSCGISDCVIPSAMLDKVHTAIAEARGKASEAIQNAKMGTLPKGENAFTYKKDFPKKIIEIMNKCRKNVEDFTAKGIKPYQSCDQIRQTGEIYNSIDTMVRCGSKGNKSNMCQIVGMMGQLEIEGSWIDNQLQGRTLPHFHKNDLRPEAHGFVEDSFMTGLSPIEYWEHAQEGRIGVITKAIKTAETGYLQRKFIKALEDVRVCYDGTVRNANNMIIQTIYGNDGFDASYLETQDMFFLNYNRERLCFKFQHLPTDDLMAHLTPEAQIQFNSHSPAEREAVFKAEMDQLLQYYQYLKEQVPTTYWQPDTRAPVHFKRLIQNAINQFGLAQAVKSDLDPIYAIQQIQKLHERFIVDPRAQVNYVSTILINSLMAIYLASKPLIYEYKMSRMAFDHLVETIYLHFLKALINPGENAGIVAAQSMGEPTTQMALNAFHHTGQGSKANVTRGVPRLKELLSLSRNPKTPSLTIYVVDEYFIQKFDNEANVKSIKQTNSDRIEAIGADIEYTILRDLLLSTEIFYDEDDHHTCIPEDQEFVESYYALLPDIDPINSRQVSQFKWLLRMEFDREAIMRKRIPMYLIENKLNEFLEGQTDQLDHSVIVSDDNAQKLICRIKLKSVSDEFADPINYLRELETHMLLIKIKGIEGIEHCLVNTGKKEIVMSDGSVISPFDMDQKAYDEAQKHYNNLLYMLDTDGSNLLEVLSLPNIDTYRTVSNDVWEIYQLYGVEAARRCIINEINRLFEENETYIQERHVSLLVDVMTNQGTLVSVDRHGVNKSESGPLHRASFEETTTQLTNASIFSEVDLMTGVSGNVMFGQFIPTGTNAFRISLDLDKIKRQVPPKQTVSLPTIKARETIDLTDFCGDDQFDFTFKPRRVPIIST
uniref:DNA-directed RNA polymerase n=1 Tax=viral metagenome TaxID=1070528 RepID=A0A6C0BL64_9ZZZZ